MDSGKPTRPEAMASALRIAVVTETYPPEINGVASTLHHMVHGLAGRGHCIELLRPAKGKEKPPRDSSSGIREIPTPGMPMPFYQGLQMGLPASRTIGRTFRESQPDIVYIATEGPLGLFAQRTARRLRLPVVAGFHTNFQTYSRHYHMGLFAPAVLAYLRRFHNRCSRTLVPTRALADDLNRRGFQRLSVWPRGVDSELFNPARRDDRLRAEWGVGETGLAVIYVGRIAPEKNIRLALQAFTEIRALWPDAKFVVVGDGPEIESLRNAGDNIILTGPRVGEALAACYASADLFLFPSLSETFGNVVTEAMASGLPVVAFDMAAAAELIHDRRNGLLATPGDDNGFILQAHQAAQDASLRQRLAAQARTDALDISWPEVIGRLEQIFLRTLRETTRGDAHESLAATPD